MSKWYGNLTNRLEEGQNFTGREIRVDDDITMYLWSDRRCYYVTEVINQKRIKVRPYFVCADKSKPGGMGHQDWLYFKSMKEYYQYIGNDVFGYSDEEYKRREENSEEMWVFRYGKWMEECYHDFMNHPDAYNKREREHFQKHGWFNTYHDLSGKVSFGIRDYHYDWEF